MLTCSVAACRGALRGSSLPLLLHLPSSKTYFFSLKQCVQKFTTRQQQCFLSSWSSSPSPLALEDSLGQTGFHTRRRRHHCCSLNLNHHISFHYINSSIVIHRFHQSTAASSRAADGSINNSLVVNDSRKPELSRRTGVDEFSEEEEEQEGDEVRKEQVWATGPAVLPTFNVAAYANESDNVKKLVRLGVDLSQWERRYGAIPLLYKSNFETTMLPTIQFLLDSGVEGPDLSNILSKNPFIFNENLGNLEKRVKYLRLKKFTPESVRNIITRNPYWLSFSVPRIDRRLGFFQTYFNLTGDQVRTLASAGTSGPKLITYHLGRVKDVTFTIKEEMGFSSQEIVKLLLTRPRIWKEVPVSLRRRFDYLHNEEKFPHEDFVRNPMLLLTRERRMKERIAFLKQLGRAQFDPKQPNYISIEMLCVGTDAEFATDVAKVGVLEYNNYLKTL